MTRRKWIYTGLLIIVIGFVLVFYNAFNGNPVSKLIAEKNVEKYLSEEYPGRSFNVSKGQYNFKFSEYNFDVIEIGEGITYNFSVRGLFNPYISDGIYFANLDEPLMEKLSLEAARALEKVIAKKSTSEAAALLNISVQLEVLKGTYSNDVVWSPDLEVEKPPYIHIIINSTNKSAEDVLTSAIVVQAALDDLQYEYDRTTINGNIVDAVDGSDYKSDYGYVKYYVSFNKDTELTIKDIEQYEE